MYIDELILKLKEVADSDEESVLGAKSFARFLAIYIDRLNIPDADDDSCWEIDPYLPQIMVGAVTFFESSPETWVALSRAHYRTEALREFASPLQTNSYSNAKPTSIVISRVIQQVTDNEHLVSQVMDLLDAENTLVRAHFYKFLDTVYARGGLYQIVAGRDVGSMAGDFGNTRLHLEPMAGKLVFTFAHPPDLQEIFARFEIEKSDPNGLGVRLLSCNANLKEILTMLEEVKTSWESGNTVLTPSRDLMI